MTFLKLENQEDKGKNSFLIVKYFIKEIWSEILVEPYFALNAWRLSKFTTEKGLIYL